MRPVRSRVHDSLLRRASLRLVALVLLPVALAAGCGDGGSDGPTSFAVLPGCYSSSYQGATQGQVGCGPIATFGDPTLDAQYLQEIQIQNNFWGLPTQVYAFDECQGVRNALSFPQGFILFGRNLSWSVVQGQGSSAALSGAMAHEFGHQAQFRFGWISQNQSTPRNSELEADAFGGYFMVLAKGFPSTVIDQYYALLQSLGDFDFNSPTHHGTPTERKSAGALGVAVALNVIATGVPLTYAQLHQAFSTQITSLALRGSVEIARAGTPGADDSEAVMSPEDAAIVTGVAKGTATISDFDFPGCKPSEVEHLWPARDKAALESAR